MDSKHVKHVDVVITKEHLSTMVCGGAVKVAINESNEPAVIHVYITLDKSLDPYQLGQVVGQAISYNERVKDAIVMLSKDPNDQSG